MVGITDLLFVMRTVANICYNIYYCTNQVRSITPNIVPLQSGSVFYEPTKLTGAQYKHRYIFTLDGSHRVIFTLDDRKTMAIYFTHQKDPLPLKNSDENFFCHC